eukprot:gene15317-15566_t
MLGGMVFGLARFGVVLAHGDCDGATPVVPCMSFTHMAIVLVLFTAGVVVAVSSATAPDPPGKAAGVMLVDISDETAARTGSAELRMPLAEDGEELDEETGSQPSSRGGGGCTPSAAALCEDGAPAAAE